MSLNMTSNLETLVTVFGGSGFLGRNVVRALCKRDYRVRVAVRRPELAFHLQPLGKALQKEQGPHCPASFSRHTFTTKTIAVCAYPQGAKAIF